MASLKLTYEDVYKRVSQFLGLGSSPSGDDLTLVKDITKRGYRKFLMPIDQMSGQVYNWTFLQNTTTLSVVADTDTYTLPEDFSSIVFPFTHTSPTSYNPIQKSIRLIYELKSEITGTGYPVYFGIKTGDYDAVTGQQYEVVFHPTPSGSMTYYYTYIAIPPALENDDDYFVGESLASEAIIESALAVAELQEDETIGIHNQEAERLIQSAIGMDKRVSIVPNLGAIVDGKSYDYKRFPIIYDSSSNQVLPE